MRDALFTSNGRAHDFVFDENVADVFDGMLDRSIPLYEEVQRMVVELGTQFAEPVGTVYDVGCSTGNTLLGFANTLTPDRPVDLVGVEPSAAMRVKTAEKLAAAGQSDRVQLLPDPIETFASLPDARVIVMLYALQFVRPIHRARVVSMYFESLAPGGCLLLAEKLLPDSSMLSRLYIDLYHDYKERNGYSRSEIARKREALENVLVPYRDSENRAMLHEAGFDPVDHAFRWYNFALYLAVKG